MGAGKEGGGGVRNSFVVASWYFCPLQKNILADYCIIVVAPFVSPGWRKAFILVLYVLPGYWYYCSAYKFLTLISYIFFAAETKVLVDLFSWAP
jgi:hypothetical protein